MEAMHVNYKRMQKQGDKIKKQLDKAKEIRITTPAGTDVTAHIEDMTAISNTGKYVEAGAGGNMPAGEVYIAPKGMRGVTGKVV